MALSSDLLHPWFILYVIVLIMELVQINKECLVESTDYKCDPVGQTYSLASYE